MYVRSEQLITRVRPGGVTARVVQFPLSRIVIVAAFLLPVAFLHNLIVDRVLSRVRTTYFEPLLDLEFVINLILFIAAYRVYTRLVERREAYEFSLNGVVSEFALGFGISAAIVWLVVALMATLGYYTVDDFDPSAVLVHVLFSFGSGAFVQRLVFSVMLFKLIEEFLGSWIAIALLAFAFGFAHYWNENATGWTSLSLVLSDGLLMAAAYMYTRRIWLVWGLHFGWDYVQDGIFGMPNSGIISLPSWIDSTTSGPSLLTGGDFGIEASVVAILLQLGVGVLLLRKAIERRQLVAPLWYRRAEPHVA